MGRITVTFFLPRHVERGRKRERERIKRRLFTFDLEFNIVKHFQKKKLVSFFVFRAYNCHKTNRPRLRILEERVFLDESVKIFSLKKLNNSALPR